jgi:hypothetical protein
MNEEKELGIIASTELGFEHGVLTFMLTFDFGGTGQGFGGYCLDDRTWHKDENHIPGVTGAGAIAEILKAVGVQKWEDLKGREMFALRNGKGTIYAIEAPKYRDGGGKFDIEEYFHVKVFNIADLPDMRETQLSKKRGK